MQQLKVELLLTQAIKNEPLKKVSKTQGKMTRAEAAACHNTHLPLGEVGVCTGPSTEHYRLDTQTI
jgi:hypothetical protein